MLKKHFRLWLLIILLSGWLSQTALFITAKSIPSPSRDFYVLDEAGVLSKSTIDTIVSISSELHRKTKAQLVVVIVDSLYGEPIESTALTILREWGLGDKDLDNGCLILLSIEDQHSRIEVGYGLEGALNDAKTGRIQDTYMLPYYTQGDLDSGIRNGYMAVAAEIAKEYQITLTLDKPVAYIEPFDLFGDVPLWGLIIGGLIVLIVLSALDLRFLNGSLLRLILTLVFSFGKSSGSSGGGGFGGGGGSSRKW